MLSMRAPMLCLAVLSLFATSAHATRVDLANGGLVVDITHTIDPNNPDPSARIQTYSNVAPLSLNTTGTCWATGSTGCSLGSWGTAGGTVSAGAMCFSSYATVRCFHSAAALGLAGGHWDQQVLTTDERVLTGCVASYYPSLVYRCHVVYLTETGGTTCLTFGRWGDDHPTLETMNLACVTP